MHNKIRERYTGSIPQIILRPIRAGILQKIDHTALVDIVLNLLKENNKHPSLKEYLNDKECDGDLVAVAENTVVEIEKGNFTRVQLIDSSFWYDDYKQRKNGTRFKKKASKEITVASASPLEVGTSAECVLTPRSRKRQCRRANGCPAAAPSESTTTATTDASNSSPRPGWSYTGINSGDDTRGARAAPPHSVVVAAAGAPSSSCALTPPSEEPVCTAANADERAPGAPEPDDPDPPATGTARSGALVVYTGVGAEAQSRWAPVVAAIARNGHCLRPFWDGMIAPRLGVQPDWERQSKSESELRVVLRNLHAFAAVLAQHYDTSACVSLLVDPRPENEIKNLILRGGNMTIKELYNYINAIKYMCYEYPQIID